MRLTFDALIAGKEIRCEIGSDMAISEPIFCFSLMVKPGVVLGGTLVARLVGSMAAEFGRQWRVDVGSSLPLQYSQPGDACGL